MSGKKKKAVLIIFSRLANQSDNSESYVTKPIIHWKSEAINRRCGVLGFWFLFLIA